jgi:hypothetical protein
MREAPEVWRRKMKMRAGCDDDKYNRSANLVLDEEKRKWFEQRQKERCG